MSPSIVDAFLWDRRQLDRAIAGLIATRGFEAWLRLVKSGWQPRDAEAASYIEACASFAPGESFLADSTAYFFHSRQRMDAYLDFINLYDDMVWGSLPEIAESILAGQGLAAYRKEPGFDPLDFLLREVAISDAAYRAVRHRDEAISRYARYNDRRRDEY